ncbi:MAG: hypothetical protein Q7S50_00355 [bacterium]|nr:hypothetical protein [bacterium]
MRGFESRRGLMSIDAIRIGCAILSGLLLVAGTIPYIRDVLSRTTHPNIVSWVGWSLLTTITIVAQFAKGTNLSLVVPIASTIGTATIAVLGIRYGYAKFNTLDKVCFVLGVVAIISWIATKEPLSAIIISIIADILFLLPTSIKSYRLPHSETMMTYVLLSAGALFGLLSSNNLELQNILYPVYLFLAYASTVCILIVRRNPAT